MDYSLLKRFEVFLSDLQLRLCQHQLSHHFLRKRLAILLGLRKLSSQPFDALNSVLLKSLANWSAFSYNMGPKMGSFLRLISLNHSQINSLISLFPVLNFTLKHLLLSEICTREICEKFVYKHSETIEYVIN